MNEAEQDVKNYADRGGCYPPRLKAEVVDNILRRFRDLHNSSPSLQASSLAAGREYFKSIRFSWYPP